MYPVLLYDGGCGFCNSAVQFVLRFDRTRTLRFAPLDSPYGERVRAEHPGVAGQDSMIWLDPTGEPSTRSAALIRLAQYLGGLWGFFGKLFWAIPAPVRDWEYQLLASHRHRIAGARCLIPPAAEAHRFL